MEIPQPRTWPALSSTDAEHVLIAVISDVHSNLPALEVVLDHITTRHVDRVYCLGDVVGYGAQPVECVERVRETCHVVVAGNHDLAVADGAGEMYLPRDGQVASAYNRELLSADDREWLRTLPLRYADENGTFVHASPQFPERWMRIESFIVAQAQFACFDTEVCFLGHTHLPAVLSDSLGVLRVRKGHRYLVNVGSVGQPRDGDPRASVAYFDTETFAYDLVRLPYNVTLAARHILDAGLPRSLARRLEKGA